MKDRVPTASERIYKAWLGASLKQERANLEGELVAICIAACRTVHYAPPYEWHEYDDWHQYREYGRRSGRWLGGPFGLPTWVRGWVSGELSGEQPLEDGGLHIGRRCVNALIDKIRWYKRRKRGAPERFRESPYDDDPPEKQWSRDKVRRALIRAGLPAKLPIAGDRELFERLVAEYPKRLTNVAIARVPFRADFSEAPETTIDATLRGELPGILAELITLCPSVIRDGLRPPAAVRLSTDELFAELDVAARFQTDCLLSAPDDAVAVSDVSTAAIVWAQREGLDTDVRSVMGELRKRFGKRYAFRKVEGKSVRVFTGVRLLDSLPTRHSGVTVHTA